MPTRLTEDIKKGITFKQFALQCARSFGTPMDANIPDEVKPYDYHARRLKECKDELIKLNKITLSQAEKLCDKFHNEMLNDYNKIEKESKELKIKYEQLLEKINRYAPPTDAHLHFKKFMIDEVQLNIDWDCMDLSEYYKQKKPSAKKWLSISKKTCKKSIEYHKKANQKEIESAKKATQWIKDLKKSIELIEN